MTSRWIMNMNWWFPEPKPSPPEDKTPSTRKGFRVIAEDADDAADLARARMITNLRAGIIVDPVGLHDPAAQP